MDVTIVIMTRNRAGDLLSTLERLRSSHAGVPIVVADNGSTDGTASGSGPSTRTSSCCGSTATSASGHATSPSKPVTTPYVAFNDDDSWWAPGTLPRVAALFDRHRRLGAVTAHLIVEPDGHDDPTSLEMRRSPLDGDPEVPGVPVLGFLACATAVRREAFGQVGGFEPRLHFGGEEELLATDLAVAGWEVRYVPDLRVHHAASGARDHRWRQRRGVRNTLWYLWLRRPASSAARRTVRLLRDAAPPAAVGGLLDALRGAAWVARDRRVVPPELEAQLRRLDEQQVRSSARQYAA